VASKRHMHIAMVSGSQAKISGGNPYEMDATHIKEAIKMAESIVKLEPATVRDDAWYSSLSTSLERLSVLLTPGDEIGVPLTGTKMGDASSRDAPSGVSYDSSAAGMAANALLTKFMYNPANNNPQSRKENLAVLLANALARILSPSNIFEESSISNLSTALLHSMKIQAVIAITQLASTEPPPPPLSSFDQEEYSPYGHPPPSLASTLASAPTSWCHLFVNSNVLPTLIQHLSIIPDASAPVSSNLDIDLVEKCVWAIGNLAGDSEMARQSIIQSPVTVPKLISCLFLGIAFATNSKISPERIAAIPSILNLIRNTVWTMTNLVREGSLPSWMLIEMQNPMNYSRVNRQQLSLLLSCPERLADNSAGSTVSSWYDIAAETCWLLFFLTSGDDAIVQFLCSTESTGGKEIISSIVTRLAISADATIQRFDNTASTFGAARESAAYKASLSCIPCCRLLRNIAIASSGKFVPSILCAETNTRPNDNPLSCSVEHSLAKLLPLGFSGAGNEPSTIASEAASTAGACLFDAGLSLPHPSTNASRTLLPALVQAMVHPLSKFDFRREVTWAIWNAVNVPEDLFRNEDGTWRQDVNRGDVLMIQKDLLVELLKANPNETIRVLTASLSSVDSDAAQASLLLINAILRKLGSDAKISGQIGRLTILFEEAGLVEALNIICDLDTEEGEMAEMAAELIDEFFDEREDDGDEDDFMAHAGVSDGQFQFQAPTVEGIPKGGFNFGDPSPMFHQQQHQQIQSPMGRGRGRGQVVPAWMQRQQEL